jgi:hypothetical protein
MPYLIKVNVGGEPFWRICPPYGDGVLGDSLDGDFGNELRICVEGANAGGGYFRIVAEAHQVFGGQLEGVGPAGGEGGHQVAGAVRADLRYLATREKLSNKVTANGTNPDPDLTFIQERMRNFYKVTANVTDPGFIVMWIRITEKPNAEKPDTITFLF